MLKLAYSNQKNISFVFCPYPITIDKSSDWGEGNIQNFPNGAYLKQNEEGLITHGVQPHEKQSSPIGWRKQANGLFRKEPIWVIEKLALNKTITLNTLDGAIIYQINEPSYLVAQNKNNKPNFKDVWVLSLKEFEKNYSFQE